MKNRMIILFSCFILAGTLFLMSAAQQEQQVLAEKLIRLHVVAHSDAKTDQAEKLLVRDAVLAVTEPLAAQADDPKQAFAMALPEIHAAAEACLRSLGSNRPVTVTLCRERFPTRTYESFALPAGVYPTLRVTIGDGHGKNWWCVAFPSICFQATAADLEEAAVSAGFTQKEVQLITEGTEHYIFKFKFLELLDRIKCCIFS